MDNWDLTLELYVVADQNAWELPVKIRGKCLVGCKTRKLIDTNNLLAANKWVIYHRDGEEHQANLIERRMGPPEILVSQIADPIHD